MDSLINKVITPTLFSPVDLNTIQNNILNTIPIYLSILHNLNNEI